MLPSRYRVYGLEFVNAPDGSIIYFLGERAYLLPIPPDALAQETAGTPYVLSIAANIPSWRPVATGVVSTGWGMSWGTSWG